MATNLATSPITCPRSGPVSTILTSAIASSLTHLGYDPHLIQRVSLLTTSNTHTAVCDLPSSITINKTALASALLDAFSALFANIEAKGTKINSNEPVLLVNAIHRLDATDLHALTDAAAATLRDEYHARPVRVYAGTFSRSSTSSVEETHATFSISLLNVVNTDIGGPGMVQLLDMVDWQSRGCVRREHWEGNGWDCVLREDNDAEFVEVDVKKDLSEDGASETGEGEWESEPEVEVEEKHEEETAKSNTQGNVLKQKEAIIEEVVPIETAPAASGDTTAAANIPKEPEADEEEAEDSWTQRSQLRDIKHPSWEREHDKESLLDMITRQSQRLSVSKGGGGGNAYATAAKEKTELEGEDEYEIV